MGYPKKHRGRRKMGSKKRRARKKNQMVKVLVEKQMFMHMKKVKEIKAFLDITLFLLLK